MDRAKKVLAAAALLVKLHSQKASEVARQWSKDLTERNDAEAAAVCLEIADAAAELLTKSAASEAREPALSDILSGAVTREVMRGDHVKPSDVKRLMTKAKRRRSRSTMKWDHPTEPRRAARGAHRRLARPSIEPKGGPCGGLQ